MGNWDLDDKVKVYIAVNELGSSFSLDKDTPEQLYITLYTCSLKELAAQFVEDGLYGDIASSIWCYIDYEAIAYDLRCDYVELTIAGHDYIYCCD
jgi:antirestriction protein